MHTHGRTDHGGNLFCIYIYIYIYDCEALIILRVIFSFFQDFLVVFSSTLSFKPLLFG